jgi:hypothetical protein
MISIDYVAKTRLFLFFSVYLINIMHACDISKISIFKKNPVFSFFIAYTEITIENYCGQNLNYDYHKIVNLK